MYLQGSNPTYRVGDNDTDLQKIQNHYQPWFPITHQKLLDGFWDSSRVGADLQLLNVIT